MASEGWERMRSRRRASRAGGGGEARVSSRRVRNAVRQQRTPDEDGAIAGPVSNPDFISGFLNERGGMPDEDDDIAGPNSKPEFFGGTIHTSGP